MLDTTHHIPVLLDEVINSLSLKDEGFYVDATFGLGGYSKEILSNRNCNLLAIDRDPEAKKFAQPIKSSFKDKFTFVNGRFSELIKFLEDKKV